LETVSMLNGAAGRRAAGRTQPAGHW
jgi:hypothetical protein